jgi:hypothetical protein
MGLVVFGSCFVVLASLMAPVVYCVEMKLKGNDTHPELYESHGLIIRPRVLFACCVVLCCVD